MARKPKVPTSSYLEQMKHIRALIKNAIVDNKNYCGEYFAQQTKHDLLHDTIERGKYILEQLDDYITGEQEELQAEAKAEETACRCKGFYSDPDCPVHARKAA